MSAKSILEADGKAIINYHLTRAPVIKPSPLSKSGTHNPPSKLASLYFPEDAEVSDILNQAETSYPWLLVPGSKFVAKPDQLIKRRGKSGLLALNKTWPEAKAWIASWVFSDNFWLSHSYLIQTELNTISTSTLKERYAYFSVCRQERFFEKVRRCGFGKWTP
jgi:hypothetical protein